MIKAIIFDLDDVVVRNETLRALSIAIADNPTQQVS